MTEAPRWPVRITRLSYADELLGTIDLPKRTLAVTRGLGSGLAHRAGDPANRIWAVGDRGPNLKVPFAIEHYGLRRLGRYAKIEGAKVMPCPDIGPAISELRIEADRVVHVRTLPLRDRSGKPLSGVPIPGGFSEPAFDLDGTPIDPYSSGADTEGIAAASLSDFHASDSTEDRSQFGESTSRAIGRFIRRDLQRPDARAQAEGCVTALPKRFT